MTHARLLAILVCIAANAHAAADFFAGTGFFYNTNGDLLTNRHVIEKCATGSILVRPENGNIYPARVLAVDDRIDLAAISIEYAPERFASLRLFPGTKTISVPESIEDVFSAGFSDPSKNNFKMQYKWGQIQQWKDPNKFPYVNRMRMDAYPGASGSPILDYAGLLVGIVFAGSVGRAEQYSELRQIGYGDKWIYIYNNNAILLFANKFKLNYAAWDKWKRLAPTEIIGHAGEVTALILCRANQ